jgi:type II secretory pathway pseudopilin PulG
MKRFSQGLKSAERELDKLNKKASKPRNSDEREKARAAKAQARVEAQAAKEAARNAQRRERAELNSWTLPAALNQCNTLPMLS